MLPQRAVQKLGRHFHGLDNYMVASYPQQSGEREFREIVRDLKKMGDKENVQKELVFIVPVQELLQLDTLSQCLVLTRGKHQILLSQILKQHWR